LRNGFSADGPVNFTVAVIEGHFECDNGIFDSDGSAPALDLRGGTVNGSVNLRWNFRARGGVELQATKIGGYFECDGGGFASAGGGVALNANSATVSGNVALRRGFKAEGGVVLTSAKVGGDVDCAAGIFNSETSAPALIANAVKVGGSVKLRQGFRAAGRVDFANAKIGADLDCDDGEFVHKSGEIALIADSAEIGGSALFRKTKVVGTVFLGFANIGANLQWYGLVSPERCIIDLYFTETRILLNAENSWPNPGNLNVDGFIYEEIDREASLNADVQLRWLARQSAGRFASQPYEQLAKVFRKMGLEDEARKVLIRKNKEHSRHVHGPGEWLWYAWIGKLVGYGYEPWRAFALSLVVLATGWIAFRVGYDQKIVTPTETAHFAMPTGTGEVRTADNRRSVPTDYPKFNAFAYSVETFVPFLRLEMATRWSPNPHLGSPLPVGLLAYVGFPRNWGSLLRYYLWFHIIAGWTLTSLWVGAVTGLVKT